MNKLSDVVNLLPEMKSGEELKKELAIMPEYDASIRDENMAVRLMRLSDIFNIYVPYKMTEEIYYKLYLALVRSLQKKGTREAVIQQNENHKAILSQEYKGIIGGSDSFTIIGMSGIGKSTAISRAISLIGGDGVIELESPYSFIIPCVVVQCPWDSSVKNLLLEILRKVDEQIGSNYYNNAIRARSTTDMLIGNVSQVSLNHIGILIVDEIQNVVNSRNGESLVGMLTQLINNSGISICMVGTPEAALFFESAMYLARRSLGLRYQALDYGDDFHHICKVIFSYQYVKKQTYLTEALTEWLFEHSGGIIANVVALIHDAQEIAIMDGSETIDKHSLNEAYANRLTLLHDYITPMITKGKQTTATRKTDKTVVELKEDYKEEKVSSIEESRQDGLIAFLAQQSKKSGRDMVRLLKENVVVMEVAV